MITDIKLDKDKHDLSIEGDNLILFSLGEESIAQRLKIGLSTAAGEWFLDVTKGLPLTKQAFSQKGSQTVLDAYIRRYITEFEGIQELLTYSSRTDRATRTAIISFTARTDSGEILSFSEAI